MDLQVASIRRVSGAPCLFPDLFQGFEKVAAVKRIFGARTNQTLKSVRILFSTRKGYLRVDNDTGDIIISSPYLKTAAERDFYLDLIHELVHVKQFKQGKDLFDKKYSYVDRPTESEAYSRAADELVKKHGDWSPDYLIPQVFVEFEDGEVKHVLTGYPEGVEYTGVAVDNLVRSEMFRTLRAPPG